MRTNVTECQTEKFLTLVAVVFCGRVVDREKFQRFLVENTEGERALFKIDQGVITIRHSGRDLVKVRHQNLVRQRLHNKPFHGESRSCAHPASAASADYCYASRQKSVYSRVTSVLLYIRAKWR